MKAMHKSKCVYCEEGVVFNEDTTELDYCYFCDIDAWDETVRCKEGWCPYYKREQESEVK